MIVIDGTLKQRLAGWLLAAVGLLGTFLLIEAYTSAQRAAGRAYDSQLQAASLTIAEAVQWQDGEPIVEIPAAALQILATDHQERVFYTLLNAAGQQITGNLNRAMAKSLGDAFSTNPMWKFAQNRGVRIRLYGRELRSAGWESSEPVQIWVGHTMSGREALAKELFLGTLTRFLAMVALTALLSILAIRMALQPVRRLRRTLLQRKANDVSPVGAQVPGELYELVETLNVLFERQRQGRNTFTAIYRRRQPPAENPISGPAERQRTGTAEQQAGRLAPSAANRSRQQRTHQPTGWSAVESGTPAPRHGRNTRQAQPDRPAARDRDGMGGARYRTKS
ncbi:MAG: sensor histidine kinase N-terminal domain-containing protein [Marinobacter sp.]|nr:sensor histidine kinase N-terminal domain-containing protein [Marinobacter sp.]MCL1480887.1 sensor histidine kinase N-terminal domain-containing protein [Marinobacter sp.]